METYTRGEIMKYQVGDLFTYDDKNIGYITKVIKSSNSYELDRYDFTSFNSIMKVYFNENDLDVKIQYNGWRHFSVVK